MNPKNQEQPVCSIENNSQQWQGFEQNCQHQINYVDANIQTNEDNETSAMRKPSTKLSVNKKQNKVQKPKISPFKKNKNKEIIQPPKQQVEQNETNSKEISPQKQNQDQKFKVRKERRMERIPIMRKQQDYRYTCNLTYKNFAPRSSETYFRTLKDVTFETEPTKGKFKNGQKFIFNSCFESGNLSAAFQGGRE